MGIKAVILLRYSSVSSVLIEATEKIRVNDTRPTVTVPAAAYYHPMAIPMYAVWSQGRMCVNNLPMVDI